MSYKNSTYYDNSLQYGINFTSFGELEDELADCIRSKRDIEFVGMTEILNDKAFKDFQSRISL
jgi:hypothetical protein